MNPMSQSIIDGVATNYQRASRHTVGHAAGGDLDSGSGLDRPDQGTVFRRPRYDYLEDTKQHPTSIVMNFRSRRV